jgi:hypothetical protein
MKLKVWTSRQGWSSWRSEENKVAMENHKIIGLNGFIMMALQYHGRNSMPNVCGEMPELEDLNQIIIHADTAAANEGVAEDGPRPLRIISGQFFRHPLQFLKNPGAVCSTSGMDTDSWIVIVEET